MGEIVRLIAKNAPIKAVAITATDMVERARQIHDTWPVATAVIGGTNFKIHSTVVIPGVAGAEPGKILGLTKTGLQIACGEGAVEIRVLQAEGGKRMSAPDYFRGHPLEG